MGRIKTQMTKRISLALFREHGSEFKKSFEENKGIVSRFADIPSKKIRNIIAGYLTRLANEKTD